MTKVEARNRRLALVVGGSGGIGRAITLRLIQKGIDVVATGAHQEKLDSLAQEISRSATKRPQPERPQPARPEADVMGNLTGIAVHADRAEEILQALPGELEPDILVCAFGPVLYKPLEQTSHGEWEYLSEMNLVLPGALISRYLPAMRRRNYGRILLFGVSGSDAVNAYREIGAYGAVKTGLSVLVRSLSTELAATNVTVTALLPTYVDTEYLTDEERHRFARRNDGNQLEKPDEIAEGACYVLLAESNRYNGALVSPPYR